MHPGECAQFDILIQADKSFMVFKVRRLTFDVLDIAECAAGTHNCNTDAVCTNIKGGFRCTCKQGYTGNGVSCSGTSFRLLIERTRVTENSISCFY